MCKSTAASDIVSFQEESDYEPEESWYDYLQYMLDGVEFSSNITICIDAEEYGENTIVSNEPYIILKNDKCACCCMWIENLQDHYFIINNESNGITYSDILFQMIIGNYKTNCNHRFLEGISQIDDTNVYQLHFGS